MVLRALVSAYVGHAGPVGSTALSHLMPTALSPASIRNTLGELHELGLIDKAHASAGRVPTSIGLRVFSPRMVKMFGNWGKSGPKKSPLPTSERSERPTPHYRARQRPTTRPRFVTPVTIPRRLTGMATDPGRPSTPPAVARPATLARMPDAAPSTPQHAPPVLLRAALIADGRTTLEIRE